MFLALPIRVDISGGEYLLTVVDRDGKSKRRVATEEEARRAWFFVTARLECGSSSDLHPFLELYYELTGDT